MIEAEQTVLVDTPIKVTLRVQVRGSGPPAPMREAMGRPLLPKLAKGFAGQLKTEIENQDEIP